MDGLTGFSKVLLYNFSKIAPKIDHGMSTCTLARPTRERE